MSKRFLYLFQVEQDFPPYLETAASPDGDIVFLSYRQRSADRRSIFYPSSSWTQGRNRLLKEVLGRPYQYFIFGDGDVRLELTAQGAAAGRPGDPWRAFEQFLIDHEPALGCPSYFWHLSGRRNNRADVETLRFFDPLLNAFHREALVPLLPYYDRLDEDSEQYSGSLVGSIAADLYPGHVLQTNHVRVVNTLSQRGDTERILAKPESLYLASLRDPALAGAYRRQLHWEQADHPSPGPPRVKSSSYCISADQLARRYDTDHDLWARKRALLDLPADSEFFSDSMDTERARQWRARHERIGFVPPSAVVRVRQSALLLPMRLFARKWSGVRRRVRTLPARMRQWWDRWRRRLRRPNARGMWRQWVSTPARSFEFSGADASRIYELIGFVLDRIGAGRIVFIEVGTGRGEVLGQLESRTVLMTPVLSIGVDAEQTRGFTWYSGYVLGTISDTFTLADLARQYGVADGVLHYVRISEGDGAATFNTLGELTSKCLFVSINGGDNGAVEAKGFRRLGLVRTSTGEDPSTTFVNISLLNTLLPGFAP